MVTYWAVLAGLMRAGYVPFPISTRNSPGAIAHLLSKTQATHLVVGPEKKYQDLAAAAYQLMEKDNVSLLPQTTMPVFEDIYKDASVPYDPLPPYKPGVEDAALMTHSSGMSIPRQSFICFTLTSASVRLYCIPETNIMDVSSPAWLQSYAM